MIFSPQFSVYNWFILFQFTIPTKLFIQLKENFLYSPVRLHPTEKTMLFPVHLTFRVMKAQHKLGSLKTLPSAKIKLLNYKFLSKRLLSYS